MSSQLRNSEKIKKAGVSLAGRPPAILFVLNLSLVLSLLLSFMVMIGSLLPVGAGAQNASSSPTSASSVTSSVTPSAKGPAEEPSKQAETGKQVAPKGPVSGGATKPVEARSPGAPGDARASAEAKTEEAQEKNVFLDFIRNHFMGDKDFEAKFRLSGRLAGEILFYRGKLFFKYPSSFKVVIDNTPKPFEMVLEKDSGAGWYYMPKEKGLVIFRDTRNTLEHTERVLSAQDWPLAAYNYFLENFDISINPGDRITRVLFVGRELPLDFELYFGNKGTVLEKIVRYDEKGRSALLVTLSEFKQGPLPADIFKKPGDKELMEFALPEDSLNPFDIFTF
jgi:hypothetical protein